MDMNLPLKIYPPLIGQVNPRKLRFSDLPLIGQPPPTPPSPKNEKVLIWPPTNFWNFSGCQKKKFSHGLLSFLSLWKVQKAQVKFEYAVVFLDTSCKKNVYKMSRRLPKHLNVFWTFNLRSIFRRIGDHSFSTYTKFSEKLTFLTPWYAHAHDTHP